MMKVSMIILVVVLALAACYSIAVIISPTMVLEGDFRAMTGKGYQEVMGPDAVRIALVHIRHMEVFAIAATIAAFFIIFAGFRKAEKWAWWATLILGFVTWGYGTILNYVIRNMFDFTVFLAGFVVFMIALFLPIKRFFLNSA